MRSDSKQACILLIVAVLAMTCVVVAYMDRDKLSEQVTLLQREVSLYQAEQEGMDAEQGAVNVYLETDTAKAIAWQLGYKKTHQSRQ